MMANGPLVSVGIPTYNRPEGLKRTLTQISAQSYQNLEIIVSDNCSENVDVEKFAAEFAAKDPRIKYVRQKVNIGMAANFSFVLENAKGEYFMWASDDDEWDPEFIAECIKHIGTAGGVMQSSFKTVYRSTNTVEYTVIPDLSTSRSPFENAISFIQNIQPCLAYGLFKRTSLDFVLTKGIFTGIDLYLPTRIILTDGFNTFPKQLFTYGIDTEQYVMKSVNPKKSKVEYSTEASTTVKFIMGCRNISLREKIILSKCHLINRLTSYVRYEKKTSPVKAAFIYRFLQVFIFLNNLLCKLTGTVNYSIKSSK